MVRLSRNKRGVAEDFILWPIRIIVLVAVVTGIVMVVNYSLKSNIQTHNLGYKVLIEKSISCFSEHDPLTYRELTGTIDKDKFKQEAIAACINTTSDIAGIGIKYTLESDTIFLNKDFFVDYEPISWSEKYQKIKEKRLVMQKDAATGKLEPKYLEIEAVVRTI